MQKETTVLNRLQTSSGLWKTALALSVVIGLASTGVARAQNAAKGKEIFQQNCSVCHSPDPGQNRVGPSLYDIVGKKAATVPNFYFSPALKAFGKVWTPELLMEWLKDPQKLVPGTRMTFPGLPSATERKDVIAYLETLHK